MFCSYARPYAAQSINGMPNINEQATSFRCEARDVPRNCQPGCWGVNEHPNFCQDIPPGTTDDCYYYPYNLATMLQTHEFASDFRDLLKERLEGSTSFPALCGAALKSAVSGFPV